MSLLFEWKFLGFIGLAFSKDWGHYLNGIDGVYMGFLLCIIIISALVSSAFYFIPSSKISGKWLSSVFVNAVFNFMAGCWRASVLGNDMEGEMLTTDILRTGVRFFVISILIYFILSLILKNFSTQNKNVPF